jgi:hypothetical protein
VEELRKLEAKQGSEWTSLHTSFALEHLRLMLHVRAAQGLAAAALLKELRQQHEQGPGQEPQPEEQRSPQAAHAVGTVAADGDAAGSAASGSGAGEGRILPRAAANQVQVCVVVRTYWAHGPTELGGSGTLKSLLQSLLESPHARCVKAPGLGSVCA